MNVAYLNQDCKVLRPFGSGRRHNGQGSRRTLHPSRTVGHKGSLQTQYTRYDEMQYNTIYICHAVSYHTTLYYTLPYHTTPPHHTSPYHAELCHSVQYYSVSCHAKPYHVRTTPYHTTLYHTTPYHTTPYHNTPYYTTKLLGGLRQKIHQSGRAIAGLIFSSIRPEIELFKMADCRGDRGLHTFLSKHKAILLQATKAPTLSLVWTFETIWEDQRKLLNMKTAKSLRTAAELQDSIEEHKSNNTVRKTISIWHANAEALWYNDELDKRTETAVTIMIKLYKKSDEYNQFDFQSSRAEYSLHLPFLFLSFLPKRLGPYCQDLGHILPVRPSHSVNKIYTISNHITPHNITSPHIVPHRRVLARPKRQGAAPCRFIQRPVVFPQRPVVFSAPSHFPRALWFLWAFISVILSLKLQKASN